MMTTQERNKLDKQIEASVRRRCAGLAINIMDIREVYKAAYIAHSGVTGQDVEAAVVETYTRLSRDCAAQR
jgi:hypothetical protein